MENVATPQSLQEFSSPVITGTDENKEFVVLMEADIETDEMEETDDGEE